jgi:hypothetical protein
MKNTFCRSWVALFSVWLFLPLASAQIVPDGSFEAIELGPGQMRTPAPGESVWTYSTAPSSALARLFISGIYNSDAPNGYNAIYLWATSGLYGSVEQNVTLPAKGRYRLTYYEAGRQPFTGAQCCGDTTYAVTLGGTVLTTKTTATYQAFELEEVLFDGEPGTYLLKFALTTATAMNNMALFDHIVIEQLPESMTIDVSPQEGHVPTGGQAIFSASVAGVPLNEVQYQWLFNGADLAGATSPTLVISNADAGDIGMYSVRVTHAPSAQVITSTAVLLMVSDLVLESYLAVEIRFPSEVGKSYQLQSSTDLVTWTNVGTPLPGTGASIVEHFRTTAGSYRYLRVQEL